MKTILVCITGAVSAAAMPSYVLQMRMELNVKVVVMLSNNATRFVTPYSLRVHSGNDVYTNSYQVKGDILVPHIKLTQEADLLLVMPATANILAKAAYGICDDLISTSVVAASIPVIFVPSMNSTMWFNRTVQRNIKELANCGYYILEPRKGIEIEGLKETYGVMPLLSDIILVLRQILNSPKEKE